jgi:hypothetical protein
MLISASMRGAPRFSESDLWRPFVLNVLALSAQPVEKHAGSRHPVTESPVVATDIDAYRSACRTRELVEIGE